MLQPIQKIPENERWLFRNSLALKSVMKGLDQGEQGKTKKIERDFSKFVKDKKSAIS